MRGPFFLRVFRSAECRLAERRILRRDLTVESLEGRDLPTAQFMASMLGFESLQVDLDSYDASSILVRFQSQTDGLIVGDLSVGAAAMPGTAIGQSIAGASGFHVVNLDEGVTVETALALYRADPNVLYAEPDYRISLAALPSDPRFDELWDFDNVGQTGGVIDADIDAPAAWDVNTGSGSTIVAVIDTGIDYSHPDLAANSWVNVGEIAGDGLDNDGNGYIDDVFGYDFFNGDGDPMDDNGHGTHVAGTIGAVGDNGIGIAGINWNVQLMGLKFLDASGSGSTSDAIEAIDYAVANGASVINASWGGDPFSQFLFDAIARARDADTIFVAASGNGNAFGIGLDNDATPFYPSGYDLENIIAVAATDHTDQLAGFSNYGATTVDLAAPGVNILSTAIGGGYQLNSGTSMAAPHVAGVAALVRDANPGWTYQQVIDQLLATVDPLPGLQGLLATGGRLNAASALGNPEPPPPPPTPVALPILEDFEDGLAENFLIQAGNWSVGGGTYDATPVTNNDDLPAISILNAEAPLPLDFEIQATINADEGQISIFGIVLVDNLMNGFVVFDYQDTGNFKFAGADIDADRWVIGHHDDVAGWSTDAWIAQDLDFSTDYDLQVAIASNNQVTLGVDGNSILTHAFADSLSDGAVGLGMRNSSTHFDDVLIKQTVAPPAPGALPIFEDFSDGTADHFEEHAGLWGVADGRYVATTFTGGSAISTALLGETLPANLEIQAVINADIGSSTRASNGFVIFDYQGPNDFKYAGAYVGSDWWAIGHASAGVWIDDVTFSEVIDPTTDYALQVMLENDADVTLLVAGATKAVHRFGDSLTDGSVGVGVLNATTRFDDVHLLETDPPPPPTTTSLPLVEDFEDGLAEHFEERLGLWNVTDGRYAVTPDANVGGISVSTIAIAGSLPANLDFRATVNADAGSSVQPSNAFLIFDYQDPSDFKYAGAYVGSDLWAIGHVTGGVWIDDVTFSGTLDPATDYALQLLIDNGDVTLLVDGVGKLDHRFAQPLTDGSIGLGTKNSISRFDDVIAQALPAPTTLPFAEDFEDGAADFLQVRFGQWSVIGGRYEAAPELGVNGVSTIRVDALPANFEIHTVFNADAGTSVRASNAFVIFDYQGPSDFKYVGAFVGGNRWAIGHVAAGVWVDDVTFAETINATTDYSVQVVIENDSRVTFVVDGAAKLTHDFGGSLTNGSVGLATLNATSRFDDLLVQALPTPATLPFAEDFDDGSADSLQVRSGQWNVVGGRYESAPELGVNGISTVSLASLPDDFAVQAIINADAGTSVRASNAFVIFDYRSPTDFKYAGAFVGGNRWAIGHVTAGVWIDDVTFAETISATTDYGLRVVIENDSQATLLVDGVGKLTHDFGGSLTDGLVGLATLNATSRFDDLIVQALPDPATLPFAENFDDGSADSLQVRSGPWNIVGGRYETAPDIGTNGISTIRLGALPTDVEVQAVFNANAGGSGRASNAFLIFDYQTPTDFKYAGAFVGGNRWTLGHMTAGVWIDDATFSETINATTDYALQVRIENDAQVTLLVDGVAKITHQFAAPLTDGSIGLATLNATTRFDDLLVQAIGSTQATSLATTVDPSATQVSNQASANGSSSTFPTVPTSWPDGAMLESQQTSRAATESGFAKYEPVGNAATGAAPSVQFVPDDHFERQSHPTRTTLRRNGHSSTPNPDTADAFFADFHDWFVK